MENIQYFNDRWITPEQFVDVLERSTLSLRRPVDDPERIRKMLKHANVLITAWHEDLLVGVSRALTDFSFCCYLSDLAVDAAFQHRGIGKRLISETHDAAGRDTRLILLAAPAAVGYYPKIGMENFPHCFCQ
jgi:ribosomal protein S18 acetylase RimI-like enzyme